jgi:dTDP-4-amino-4,6-dideoxygalactose transaminase
MASKIPLLDLNAQYQTIKAEIDEAMADVIGRSAFIRGPDVDAFEEEFAKFCDAEACAAVGNGTDALYLVLRALGIGSGDEVVTVAHTFIATTEAITQCGAQPVFVDIRDDTMLLNPERLEAAITPRTRAVIPVHLYGQPCNMDPILEVARARGLKVIEDAAQAHGARWRGRRIGSISDAACFSFYPGKNLGAYGDGGSIVSNDRSLIDTVRMLSNHGRHTKYIHSREGVNSRLDGLQAAILRVKLRYLDEWNAARRHIASRYMAVLGPLGVGLPAVQSECEPVWHQFVIAVEHRDELQSMLKMEGIETGIHYPCPLHLQPAYAYLGVREGSLPVTERVAARILSLPIFPEMTEVEVGRVATKICDGIAARHRSLEGRQRSSVVERREQHPPSYDPERGRIGGNGSRRPHAAQDIGGATLAPATADVVTFGHNVAED